MNKIEVFGLAIIFVSSISGWAAQNANVPPGEEAPTSELAIGGNATMEIDGQQKQEKARGQDSTDAKGGAPITMTILFDNYVFKEGLESDWGFSCLIEGTEKTILFDTGANAEVLAHNIEKLKVDLNNIDLIVISHEHGDHTGGLSWVLQQNQNVEVYVPISISERFVKEAKVKVVSVSEPVEICRNVFSTGEMGDWIKEQSLILDTQKGLVILAGCSHQGIVNILERAKEMLDKPIYLVFGGFHLLHHSDEQVKEIIERFRELGVQYCGATHCTGDRQIAMFKEAYGENYVQMGVGKTIELLAQ